MTKRWRVALPVLGLILFGLVTYRSAAWYCRNPVDGGRYFFWSSIRLDSDPLGKHSKAPDKVGCKNIEADCLPVDPLEVWIEPGWMTRILMLAAVPAFLVGGGIIRLLARWGVSEVKSFMISMPLLIPVWFCFVGWLLDRWRRKHSV